MIELFCIAWRGFEEREVEKYVQLFMDGRKDGIDRLMYDVGQCNRQRRISQEYGDNNLHLHAL